MRQEIVCWDSKNLKGLQLLATVLAIIVFFGLLDKETIFDCQQVQYYNIHTYLSGRIAKIHKYIEYILKNKKIRIKKTVRNYVGYHLNIAYKSTFISIYSKVVNRNKASFGLELSNIGNV